MQDKKQQSELDVKQWSGSKLGKEYVKAVYCHPAYLSYMQSISCIMSIWINHKLDLEKAEEPEIKLPTSQLPLDHRKSKGIPEKHLLLLH